MFIFFLLLFLGGCSPVLQSAPRSSAALWNIGTKQQGRGKWGMVVGGSEATSQIAPSGVRVTLCMCVSWRDVKLQELIFP